MGSIIETDENGGVLRKTDSLTTRRRNAINSSSKVGADLPDPTNSAPLVVAAEKAVAADGTGPNGRDRGQGPGSQNDRGRQGGIGGPGPAGPGNGRGPSKGGGGRQF